MIIRKKALVLACLAGSTLIGSAAPNELSIWYQNYNTGHNYTANDFKRDVKNSARFTGNFGNGNQRIVKFPSNSSYKRLRVRSKKGQFGGQNLNSAAKLEPRNSYQVSYSVRFSNNWQFGKGGKLAGLGGGSHPSGGRPKTDGMSIRPMWRRDSAWDGRYGGSTRNYLEAYHYWRGQARAFNGGDNSRKFGDRTYLRNATKNEWYSMDIRATLGSSSSKGRLTIKINNVTKYNHQHTYLDRGANWKMDQFTQAVFYGGGDASWGPQNSDSDLLYDNIRVRR